MELRHTFCVPASVETTWAAFNDLEGIAPCFPGATLTSVDGDSFTGTVKVKLGPIAMQYNGTGTFVERDEDARRAVIEAKGKDRRGNGTAGATVVAQLRVDGDGTAVEVSTDLSITGKPAQFGRGVIQDISDKLLGQFVDCIAARLQESDGAPTVLAEPGSDPTPSSLVSSPSELAAAEAAVADAPGGPAGPHASDSFPGLDTVSMTGDVGGVPPGVGGTTSAAHAAAPPRPAAPAAELDLGSTVLPILLKRYGPSAAVAGVVLAMVVWLRRR